MVRIHQYVTICATSFAQWGAVAALTGPQDDVHHMVGEFDKRGALVSSALQEMPGIQVSKPAGAFYIFPSIKETGKSSQEMAEYLLDEAKIAVVPGHVFGDFGEGYIRLSYANSYENLEMAI
jgi:aspartate/methionine/tyrosine aminotransferase